MACTRLFYNDTWNIGQMLFWRNLGSEVLSWKRALERLCGMNKVACIVGGLAIVAMGIAFARAHSALLCAVSIAALKPVSFPSPNE